MHNLVLLNYDKNGRLLSTLPDFADTIKRVIIVTHGWHENEIESERDFSSLIAALHGRLNAAAGGAGDVAYVGIIWPSDKYAADLSVMAMRPGVASPPVGPTSDISADDLQQRAEGVARFLDMSSGQLPDLALQAAASAGGQDDLIAAIRADQGGRQAAGDVETIGEHRDLFGPGPGNFLIGAIRRQLHTLVSSTVAKVVDNPLINWLSGVRTQNRAVVASTLNLFAYNELKIRAGVIGAQGVAALIDTFAGRGLVVHLVGHSFGARVMTSAAGAASASVASLTLLEGAYSHNGLSEDPRTRKPGAFRSVVDNRKVSGPIVAMCSTNDTAVWIAYPLASRVFRDTTQLVGLRAVFGGATDRYGAMGANGPLNVGAQLLLGNPGAPGALAAGRIYTVDASSFVSNHNDVWHDGSAAYIAAAISA